MAEYQLHAVWTGHKSDVKAIAATSDGSIVASGSRDNKILVRRNGNTDVRSFDCGVYVNSLAIWQKKYIVAGLQDGNVSIYKLDDHDDAKLSYQFKAHLANVCCLLPLDTEFVTGSWDQTAARWNVNVEEQTSIKLAEFRGHQASIWALAANSFDAMGVIETLLTASADKTIKLWRCSDSQPVKTYKGATDCVRALTPLTPVIFATCGNDGKVTIWDAVEGKILQSIDSQSGNFLYSMQLVEVSEIAAKLLVVGGEGGVVEVFTVGNSSDMISSLQLIRLPAASVWSICCVSNDNSNDLLLACSDARIYVYTQNEERFAPLNVRETFDAELASKLNAEEKAAKEQTAKPTTIKVDIGDGNAEKDLVYKPGEDPYDVAEAFIHKHNLSISQLDQIANFIISNIPAARETTPRSKSSRKAFEKKKHTDGKEYDYIFEVQDDKGNDLKLPCNDGDDLLEVAQNFVEQKGLPIEFVKQIEEFLRSQVDIAVIENNTSMQSSSFTDPFTGAGRYIPGGSCTGPMNGTDAYTGAGRYVPGTGVTIGNDPLRPRTNHTPLADYIRFDAPTSEKAADALRASNEIQAMENQLTGETLDALTQIMKSANTATIDKSTLDDLEKALMSWNIDDLKPLIDVLRLILLNAQAQKYFFANSTDCEPNTLVSLVDVQRVLDHSLNRVTMLTAIRNSPDLRRQQKNRLSSAASRLISERNSVHLTTPIKRLTLHRFACLPLSKNQHDLIAPAVINIRGVISVVLRIELQEIHVRSHVHVRAEQIARAIASRASFPIEFAYIRSSKEHSTIHIQDNNVNIEAPHPPKSPENDDYLPEDVGADRFFDKYAPAVAPKKQSGRGILGTIGNMLSENFFW